MSRSERPEFSQSKKVNNDFPLIGGGEHTVGVHVPAAERAAAEAREEKAARFIARQVNMSAAERYELLALLGLLDAAERSRHG